MAYGLGGSGHWVRTRTEKDAKTFMAEKELERERRRDSVERSEDLVRRIGEWWRALRRDG
ncbi:hypothetical protein [Janibacter alittae]|uniref:Uncharacterized protein n=1 Tax=Janibacter alittae TaxID=3115209 RepID=A0ABZ2MGW1_9MICO